MPPVVRVQRRAVVPLRIEFREIRTDSLNGQRIAPNSCTAVVLNPDDTTQSTPGVTWVQTGSFITYWDTTSLALGDYLMKIRFGYAYSSAVGGPSKFGERDVVLRLVNTL